MRISDWSSDVCSSDLPGLVAAEIVHDDDIARLEAGDQLLANIGQEAFAVDRTVEDARRGEPIAAQGAQEGHGAPVAMRGEAANPLASRPPAAQWGHVGFDPGLVDEHETRSEEHTSELQSLMRISYA